MDRKDIKDRYKQLLSRRTKANMYDGRDRIDVYTCEKCGGRVLTTYRDVGVTPFVIRCARCKSSMVHNYTYLKDAYNGKDKVLEWYRPSFNELVKMSDGAIEHVLCGGLILKR